MASVDQLLALGVVLAVAGAGSILFDAVVADADRRFLAYLVALLLGLAGAGLTLWALL